MTTVTDTTEINTNRHYNNNTKTLPVKWHSIVWRQCFMCDTCAIISLKSTKHGSLAYDRCADFNIWNNLTRLTFSMHCICVYLLWAMKLCRILSSKRWIRWTDRSDQIYRMEIEIVCRRECVNTYECNASNIDYHRTATGKPFDTWKDMQRMQDISSVRLLLANNNNKIKFKYLVQI